MSKPFNIQSPEQIAKEYAGNKQKIAQAMQMGVVDPTAGVLAGMFIDRMRAAQMQEAAPQTTVAQQVMGGGAPAPAPPQSSAGVAGLVPQAAPPMAPMAPQGMPPVPEGMPMQTPMGEAPMAEAPPMGMAAGGLADLPVPDDIFDEPTNGGFNDGYAGGGLVAFGDGGEVPGFSGGGSPTDWMRSRVTSPYGVKRSTGAHQGIDFGVPDKTPIGAPAPGKVVVASKDDINGNFVILEHPDGTRSSYSHLSAINVEPGQVVKPAEVIGLSGNTGRVRGAGGGYHLHFGARDAQGNRIDPGQFFKQIAPQTASGKWGANGAPASSSGLASLPGATTDWTGGQSLVKTFEEGIPKGLEAYDKYMPKPKREGRDKLRDYIMEQGSEEALKKQADKDKWSMLAQIGFNMAATNSPYFLQAMGAAAAAALPGAKADKKEREARKLRAFQAYADAEGIDNEEAKQRALFGLNYAKDVTGLKKDDIGRTFEQNQTVYQEGEQTKRVEKQVAGGIEQERMRSESYRNSGKSQEEIARRAAMGRASASASEDVKLLYPFPPQDANKKAQWEKERDAYYQKRYQFYLSAEGMGDAAPSGGQDGVVNVPWPS